ncbi:MAG: DUF2341 domain-containing protein, partial [Candidatus Thorarchaeota archaeon]
VGPSFGAGEDYPVQLTLVDGTVTDEGNTIYSGSYSGSYIRYDWNDIAFTESDGVTELDFWVESYTIHPSEAIVWVKISDDLSSSTAVIYWYYGDSSATTSKSDGEATFLFFDDFSGNTLNVDKWDMTTYAEGTGSNSYEVSNGEFHIEATSSTWTDYRGYTLKTDDTFDYDGVGLYVKGRWSGLDYDRGGGYVHWAALRDTDNHYTANTLMIYGDYNLYTKQYVDNSVVDEEDVTDTTGGTFISQIDVHYPSWSVALTGTYSHTETGSAQIDSPFRIELDSRISYWTDHVSMDTYGDVVYLRKCISDEPQVASVGPVIETEIDMDILIVFDTAALGWYKAMMLTESDSVARNGMVEDVLTLNVLFQQYWDNIVWYANDDWMIYDDDGFSGVYGNYTDYYWGWQ